MLDNLVASTQKVGVTAWNKGEQQSYCNRVDVYSFLLTYLRNVPKSKVSVGTANRIKDKIYNFDASFNGVLKYSRPLSNKERTEAISQLFSIEQ